MTDNEQSTEIYGDPALAPPRTVTVQAGPITLGLTSDGDIRYIRVGEHELIRRVYTAVRAGDWWTVPSKMTVIAKTINDDSFRIESEARYTAADRGIDFRARIFLTGEPDGTVTFDFDGEALTDFERKRIGICVLHPADAKGVPVTVTHTNGSEEPGFLPGLIAPHQPFFDIAAIRHAAAPGVSVEVAFSGDVFEMEDQRNWLDASFKTYSTPLALPSPVLVKAGERVRQTVMIRVSTPSPPAPPSPRSGEKGGVPEAGGDTTVQAGETQQSQTSPFSPERGEGGEGGTLPSVGIVWSEEFAGPNGDLSLPADGHIWVELDLAKPRWQDVLRRVSKVAARQQLTVFACLKNVRAGAARSSQYQIAIPDVESAVEWFAPIADWNDATSQLGSFVMVARGSRANFTELNRDRPKPDSLHPLFFSGNPQVHATDSLSIAETSPMIAEAIRTARAFANGRPVHVGPLTFTGPYAASDPRETARFGQEWYERILTHAIEAGADSVTLGANALPALREWHAKGYRR